MGICFGQLPKIGKSPHTLQSLSDLVKAITRLSQNNSGGNDEDSEDTNVEATIRSLFPSTNGQSGQERDPSTQNETRVSRSAEHERSSNTPDRLTRVNVLKDLCPIENMEVKTIEVY